MGTVLRSVGLGLGILFLTFSGCVTAPRARYVYQDGQFGVIGIPVNTFLEKEDFRAQAEALMARHFPEGYEIVRAEEVTEGERTLDLGRKTEIDSEPNFSALNQMVKLGKLARTTSYEERDKLQLRECRIIYKRRSPQGASTLGQFASIPTLVPPLYIDPNELMRKQIQVQMLAQGTTPAKKGTTVAGTPAPPSPGAAPGTAASGIGGGAGSTTSGMGGDGDLKRASHDDGMK